MQMTKETIMAVLDGRTEWLDGELIGRPCFYCGQPVSAPAVYWRGCADHDDPWLLLHAGCVLELFVRLARDVHEIEKRTRRHVTVERWRCDLMREEYQR
jgi:hypothetical protein